MKVTNVVEQMRRVVKNECSMRKCAVRMMCKGLFIVCVMYGSSVWYEYMKSKYVKEIMNRCQRIVLYACLNVCNTVSTDGMQVLMDMPRNLECMSGWSICENELVTDECRGYDPSSIINMLSSTTGTQNVVPLGP